MHTNGVTSSNSAVILATVAVVGFIHRGLGLFVGRRGQNSQWRNNVERVHASNVTLRRGDGKKNLNAESNSNLIVLMCNCSPAYACEHKRVPECLESG